MAVGTVDAGVDFSALDEIPFRSSDRRTATITLPAVQFFDPTLDLDRSYVYDRDQEFLNELGGLFTDEPNYQQELYNLAEDKIGDAARQGSGIGARAEDNTREMLEACSARSAFGPSRSMNRPPKAA